MNLRRKHALCGGGGGDGGGGKAINILVRLGMFEGCFMDDLRVFFMCNTILLTVVL